MVNVKKPWETADQGEITTSGKRYEGIKCGLEEALAFEKGEEPAKGTRIVTSHEENTRGILPSNKEND